MYRSRPPLHIHAEKGNIAVVAKRLEAGDNPNQRDEYNGIPLHYAANKGRVDVVAELLRHGSEVDAVGQDGRTALHYAANKGNIVIVKNLVEYGADIGLLDGSGRTAAALAGARNRQAVCDFLGSLPAPHPKKVSRGSPENKLAALRGAESSDRNRQRKKKRDQPPPSARQERTSSKASGNDDTSARALVMAELWAGRSNELILQKLREIGESEETALNFLSAGLQSKDELWDLHLKVRVEQMEHVKDSAPRDGGYFEAPVTIEEGLLCSDNECPCPDDTALEPGQTGFLYISGDLVKNRRETPRWEAILARDNALAEQMNVVLYRAGGINTPIFLCSEGAERRNLDIDIAAADAVNWFKTGLCPLRESPTKRAWWQFWKKSPTSSAKQTEPMLETAGAPATAALAERLESNEETAFIPALQEAVTYAVDGNDLGVLAMEEAMRRRAGGRKLEFMTPKLGTLTARDSATAMNAPQDLLRLVEQGALYQDPAATQDLMSACMAVHGEDEIRNCILESRALGGLDAFYGFQLLYNHILQATKLAHARGQRSWTELQS